MFKFQDVSPKSKPNTVRVSGDIFYAGERRPVKASFVGDLKTGTKAEICEAAASAIVKGSIEMFVVGHTNKEAKKGTAIVFEKAEADGASAMRDIYGIEAAKPKAKKVIEAEATESVLI